MTSIIEFLVVFVFSFGVNLIPFAGPSNLLIPTWFPNILVGADAVTLILVGVMVALGAALAKSIHYLVTFFISGHLGKEKRERLDQDAAKVRKFAMPLLYAVAATPLPDEPIIIPLGLMKYSPAKFFTAYFLGKLTIGIAGAFLGSTVETTFAGWLDPITMAVISIALTIVITIILLKVDIGKLAEKYLKKWQSRKMKQEKA